jgi:hypothetical protein
VRTFILFLHILGAGTWLGANVTQIVASTTMGRKGGELGAAWYRTTLAMGRVLYPPAGILVAVTGIYLVVTSDVWEFSDVFVTIGMATVVIGIVLGIAVFGRQGEIAAAAAESGNDTVFRATLARLTGFGLVDTLLVVFTIYAMVAKLGS